MRVQTHPESRIVIIDDDAESVLSLERILKDHGYSDIRSTTDPRRAASIIDAFDPDLILLDLHMPYLDGYTVLAELNEAIKADVYLPVIALTSDHDEDIRKKALAAGALDFLTKPFNVDEVWLRARNLLHTRYLYQVAKSYSNELEQRVRERTRELELAEVEVVERLAAVSEYRDDETGEHTRRVGELAEQVGLKLGLSKEVAEMLRLASQLHDIGNAGIADAVLLKPGLLTPNEFAIMKTHATIGAKILDDPRSPMMKLAREIALTHHEHWAGNGYPHGLKGEEIPISGRIVSVADVYDALTHDRPYKPKWSPDRAMKEIIAGAGKKFDPKVVEAFVDVVTERGDVRQRGFLGSAAVKFVTTHLRQAVGS